MKDLTASGCSVKSLSATSVAVWQIVLLDEMTVNMKGPRVSIVCV